jgi:hypothetical protein
MVQRFGRETPQPGRLDGRILVILTLFLKERGPGGGGGVGYGLR